jgi:hypothetical protein
MNGNEYQAVIAFESNLYEGQPVVVRWTNCNRFYHGKGVVAKINAKSVRVKLTEPVPSQIGCEPYQAGREIIAPRLAPKTTWSVNNRIEPVDGYQPVEDGTSGQDRDSYSDTQDRDNYHVDDEAPQATIASTLDTLQGINDKHNACLASNAAHDAVQVIIDHWRRAHIHGNHDGKTFRQSFNSDLDDVIACLTNMKDNEFFPVLLKLADDDKP